MLSIGMAPVNVKRCAGRIMFTGAFFSLFWDNPEFRSIWHRLRLHQRLTLFL